MTPEGKKLRLLQHVSRALGAGMGLDELLPLIVEHVIPLMDAERATLYVLSDDRKTLWSRVVQGGEWVRIEVALGMGIAGWVAARGETVRLDDVYQDDRFLPTFDKQTGFRTKAMMAAPLCDRTGRVIGVLQVMNQRETGVFSHADQELFEALAGQASMALELASLVASLLRQNEELQVATHALARKTRELNVLFDVEQVISQALSEEVGGKPRHMQAWIDHVLSGIRDALGAKTATLEPNNVRISRPAIAITTASQHVIASPVPTDIEPLALQLTGDALDKEDAQVVELVAAQIGRAMNHMRSRTEQSNRDRLESIGRILSGIIHDLKTPMTIASGYAELMVECDDQEVRAQHATQVVTQIELMTTMVKDILAFARGDASVLVRRVLLHKFLSLVHSQVTAALAGRGVLFSLVPSYQGAAYFDEIKMLRVIHNLVRNAADAMPGGGQVQLTVTMDQGHLVFEVSDNGPGIPDDIQTQMFQLFASNKSNGSGLGLAIVKKVVDDHDGQLTWQSTPLGTTFTVRIPHRPISQPT